MKPITRIVVPLLSTVLLVGCEKESSEPGNSSSSSTAAQPSQTEQVKQAVSDATQKAVAEVQKQTAEVVAKVQEEAKAAYADLSKQLMESTKGQTDKLLNNISTDLQGRVQKFDAAIKDNETLSQQLTSALKALLGNNDGQAVGELGGMSSSSKLTPEQTALAKDVYNAAAALVTQRNFSSLGGNQSDVNQLVNSVWQGNYKQALVPLQNIYTKATLTPDQKQLLGKMYDSYMPADWKDSASKLQDGLNSLKTKFGQ